MIHSVEKSIILVNPETKTEGYRIPSGWYHFPASLLAVAAETKKACEDLGIKDLLVQAYDENVGDRIPFEGLEGALVGITTMTAAANRAKEIAQQVSGPVVFGGIHATACCKEMVEYGTVVKGEIESGSWKSVIMDYVHGKELKEVYFTPPSNLVGLPLASDDIYNRAGREVYTGQVISNSRGCPYGANPCDYCSIAVIAGAGIRSRPTEEVIHEMELRGMLERNNRFVMFTSDNFGTVDEDLKLLTAVRDKTKGTPFRGGIQVSVKALENQELLNIANSFDTFSIIVGIESPFRQGISKVKRGITPSLDVEDLLRNVKDNYKNICLRLLLMVGFDWEPPDIFEQMLKFVQCVKPHGVYYSVLTPLPGTKMATQLEKEGRILDRDWSKYDTRHMVFQPIHHSPEEFMRKYRGMVNETLKMMTKWKTVLSPVV